MITATTLLIAFGVFALFLFVKYCVDIYIINQFEEKASLKIDENYKLEQRRRLFVNRLLGMKS